MSSNNFYSFTDIDTRYIAVTMHKFVSKMIIWNIIF